MQESTQGARRWFDATINIQTLISLVGSVIGTALALVVIYFTLVGRVQALEQKDIEHASHFARLESDMRQQRQDVKEQLNGIGEDVKEIRRYLMDNAAGQRPDIKRWTK